MKATIYREGYVNYCQPSSLLEEIPMGWRKRDYKYMVIDMKNKTKPRISTQGVWTPNGSDAELDVLCNAWNKDQTGADGESLIWKYWHN